MVNRYPSYAAEEYDTRISLALDWLLKQGVEAKGFLFKHYVINNAKYYLFQQVIPGLSVVEAAQGRVTRFSDQPWKKDGKSYHLEHNCSSATRPILEKIAGIAEALPDTEFRWSLKLFTKWLHGGKEIRIYTSVKSRLDLILVRSSIEEVDKVLDGTGVSRQEPDFYWYESNSAWIPIKNVDELTPGLVGNLEKWLGYPQ